MVTIGEFKGNPVITLKQGENDRYGFTFGLSKAKLILEHLDAIRDFYQRHQGQKRTAQTQPASAE